MSERKINIAVVGMGFGEYFAPIYQKHPAISQVGICDTNAKLAGEIAAKYHFDWVHTDFDEVLNDKRYDAVHILTPVTTHAPLVIKALKAGKHCACAVPMGIGLDELETIIQLAEKTGLTYMMMETTVYGREYLYAKKLYDEGSLGEIQFMRGCHYQDLESINPLWRGLPPMWYMTHALCPLLAILDTTVEHVHCFGSGSMRKEFALNYGNPYPIETAIFSLKGTAAKAEITRSLFETAVVFDESFDIYGDRGSILNIGNVSRLITIPPLIKTGELRETESKILDIPYRPDLLPPELALFAKGGHGGSHPHLVHEFVSSIVNERQPFIHARRAANWSAPGICAHASAMKNGDRINVPQF